MDRSQAVATLNSHREELRKRGVSHAFLFGSAARGEARSGSDVDVMLDLDPDARISVFDYAGIVDFVQGLFSEPVDVSNRDSLKPHVRPTAERDAINVF